MGIGRTILGMEMFDRTSVVGVMLVVMVALVVFGVFALVIVLVVDAC